MKRRSHSEQRAACEALEPRLLLSTSPTTTDGNTYPLTTYDAGDSYRYFDREISLLRVAGSLVVSLDNGVTRDNALDTLAAEGGILEDYNIISDLGQGILRVEARTDIAGSVSNASTEAMRSNLAGVTGIDWVAPLFMDGESGLLQVATDEMIIKLADGVDVQDVLGADVVSYRRLGGTTDQFVLELNVYGVDVLAAVDRYAEFSGVQWADPNFYMQVTPSAVDPLYSDQWHLNNTGQSGATGDADVDAPEAWTNTAPDNDIVIAILDTGIQTDHPDLNMWVNPGETSGNSLDDDGNGWTDDVNGWDFFADPNDNDPDPSALWDNHGTAVAGVAAAIGGNEVGGKGMSYGSQIMALKMCDGVYFATREVIAEAVRYAAGFTENGLGTWDSADVLNCSWGASANATLTSAFNDAAANGRGGKGLPIFVASGNGLRDAYHEVERSIAQGDWVFEWRYQKGSSGSAGEDTAWLAYVEFPDGSVERFDSASLPTGWSTSGDVNWTIADDPAHAYGVSEYVAKAGSISHSEITSLRSPAISVSEAGTLTFRIWVSCDNYDDRLIFYKSSDGGTNWVQSLWWDGIPNVTIPVSYPASLASTIAVGASTDFDYRSHYSQYGTGLDFVAPSNGGYAGITTTDRTGDNGYNKASGDDDPLADTNYTSIFGGTSAASPLAAGIGALLLAKNPDLTASQLRSIMQDSCDQIGGVTYTNDWNQYYGYGRVNAAAALDLMDDALTGVELKPVSDMGRSNFDDITCLDNHNGSSTLDFEVYNTISGATVKLYDDTTVIGSGTGNGGTLTITTNGTVDLTDGVHNITATQTVSGQPESDHCTPETILVDTIAPTVTSIVINDGADQRNSINTLAYEFSENIHVNSVGALGIYYYDDGEEEWVLEDTSDPELSIDADTATWTWPTWTPTNQDPDLLLPDYNGYLVAKLLAAQVTDIAGNTLGADYLLGDDEDFHRLDGDIDGNKVQAAADLTRLYDELGDSRYDIDGDGDTDAMDGYVLAAVIFGAQVGDTDLDNDVDLDDFNNLKNNFQTGTTWFQGDLNGDGEVDLDDFMLLKNNFEDGLIIDWTSLGTRPTW